MLSLLSLKKIKIKYVLCATAILLLVSMSTYYIIFAGGDNSLLSSEAEVIKPENKIKVTANTELVQKIIYLKCNDEEILRTKVPENLVGSSIYQLEKIYPGWTFEKFDSNEVNMTLKVDAYCREHANHMFIGIQDGSVAVFYGKPGIKPIIKEITAIKVDKLMAQDIEELQRGIIVQSAEDLLQTLEGLQSR